MAQDGLHARVERTDESTGFIVVTTPLSIVGRSAVIVLVSDGRGKTQMKSLNFVFDGSLDSNNGVLIITTAEPFAVGAAGGTVSVPLQTNLNYRVEIATEAASWLRLTSATRAALREETLTFTADANTSAMRRAFVYLIDLATERIAQPLCIMQSGDEKALAETIRFVDPNFEKIILANYDSNKNSRLALETIDSRYKQRFAGIGCDRMSGIGISDVWRKSYGNRFEQKSAVEILDMPKRIIGIART